MLVHHLLPINDVYDHIESADCCCRPSVQYLYHNRLIIHSAFDCRVQLQELFTEWSQNARRTH